MGIHTLNFHHWDDLKSTHTVIGASKVELLEKPYKNVFTVPLFLILILKNVLVFFF